MSSLPLCLLLLVLRCNGLVYPGVNVLNPYYTYYNEYDRETIDEVILYDPAPVGTTGGFSGLGTLIALFIILPIISQLIMQINNNNNNNNNMGTGTAAAVGISMGMGMGMMGMMGMMGGNMGGGRGMNGNMGRGNMGNMGMGNMGNRGMMIGRMP